MRSPTAADGSIASTTAPCARNGKTPATDGHWGQWAHRVVYAKHEVLPVLGTLDVGALAKLAQAAADHDRRRLRELASC